ncbi:MAG: hypothetical protein ABSG91_25035 [Syntrophobacteraceae bacterium]|jgi:glucan phosphoethanolaminetransferase (alkaline phosphatase superfamily)
MRGRLPIIIFLVVVVAGGYVIMMLRNVNAAVKDIGASLEKNQEPLNQAIPNIAKASENVVAITNDLRTSLGETSKATGTAGQIATCAVVIGETAQALADLFASAGKL